MHPIDAMHQEFLTLDRQWRFMPRHTKEVETQYRPIAIKLLRLAGIPDLAIGVCGANAPTDLIVNGHPVELKISRPRKKRRRKLYFQFLLRDHDNRHHLNGNFVYCLCVLDATYCPFIIPVGKVGNRRTIEITSDPFTYTGRWAIYRGAFDLLKDKKPAVRLRRLATQTSRPGGGG